MERSDPRRGPGPFAGQQRSSRPAVYLADVEGLSNREIAETMGTPAGTVMSRIRRGRQQLRQLLPQYTPGQCTA